MRSVCLRPIGQPPTARPCDHGGRSGQQQPDGERDEATGIRSRRGQFRGRAGRDRLRAKLSYTNIGFALAPATFTISELREVYVGALGHEVSATNLQRVLVRRRLLEPTGGRREPGRVGGRPAAFYRFRVRKLEVTDQFAVLRPPGRA